MCGICGIYNYKKNERVSETTLNRMNNALTHRGPDDSGTHIEGFIGLGHTRLSIIDVQFGKQPMSNEDETIWVIYNGEIYNFRELRSDLAGKQSSRR